MNKSALIILLFSSISYCQLVVGDTIPDELGWEYCFNNDTEFKVLNNEENSLIHIEKDMIKIFLMKNTKYLPK